eukprot:TRINITY_DN54868_c0_g1_i1.p2 TRINITY_DN54868_c0_g1~~TRINITY_DN54868_c0_g1_i1.p2  ORF type:complete len:137 (+),score=1.70 TRINITY_DN54868_c0_g1_i1:171-581(+)
MAETEQTIPVLANPNACESTPNNMGPNAGGIPQMRLNTPKNSPLTLSGLTSAPSVVAIPVEIPFATPNTPLVSNSSAKLSPMTQNRKKPIPNTTQEGTPAYLRPNLSRMYPPRGKMSVSMPPHSAITYAVDFFVQP